MRDARIDRRRAAQPRISSNAFAAPRMRASLRGGPAICRPTGRFSLVKPQGSDSAVPHATVMRAMATNAFCLRS